MRSRPVRRGLPRHPGRRHRRRAGQGRTSTKSGQRPGAGPPGRHRRRWPLRSALLLLAGLLYLAVPLLAGEAPPLLLNLSGSLPEGLYLRLDRPPEVGDLVAACLPAEVGAFAREREYVAAGRRCPGGAVPVLKVVAAREGARVAYDGGRGLALDGHPREASALRQLDHRGRPIPVSVLYPYTVAAGQVLLLAPHPLSFDGRYFGPVSEEALLAVYRPLLVRSTLAPPPSPSAFPSPPEAYAMTVRLPYRLPATTASAGQELALTALFSLLGASVVLTHWFAARVGHPAGLGKPLITLPALGATAWAALAAVALLFLVLLARRPREPVTLVVGTVLLPVAWAVTSGRLYSPFAWLRWRGELVRAAAERPELAGVRDELDGAAGLALAAVLVVLAVRSLAAGSRRGDVHGSARPATSREIARLGLRRRRTGVVVGGELRGGRPRYFHAPDRRHVGIFGPSGCGKTTKLIVPTLLSDASSMVVLDVKMELYHLTAGYRARGMGQRVFAFAPSVEAPWVAGYNPLLDIPRGPQEVAYAQALAGALVDPEGRIRTPDFWHASAESLLAAAILHVLYAGPDRSLAGVLALLASPERDIKELLRRMQATEHDPRLEAGWLHPQTGDETPTHPVVYLEAAKLLDLAYETLTGIVATARSRLALFLDPIVAANTRRHDFSLAELGDPGRLTTVYLIIPARDIGRLAGLLRLFLQQLSFHLTGGLAVGGGDAVQGQGVGAGGTAEGASGGRAVGGGDGVLREVARAAPAGHHEPAPRPEPGAGRRLTLVLDELAAVGKLDLIARQIAYLRGYGIQVIAAVQTANQLYEVYGDRESVRGNLGYLVAFPSTEQRTAEEISRLLGDRTLYVETRGRSTMGSVFATRRTTNLRDTKRPLLTPDEVRRLGDDRPVLLVTGAHPVFNRMVGYYRVRGLRGRAEWGVPPVRTDGGAEAKSWADIAVVAQPRKTRRAEPLVGSPGSTAPPDSPGLL